MLQLLTNEIRHRLARESTMMPRTPCPIATQWLFYHKNSKITSSSACSSALLLLTHLATSIGGQHIMMLLPVTMMDHK
jgi:hypothetical protein